MNDVDIMFQPQGHALPHPAPNGLEQPFGENRISGHMGVNIHEREVVFGSEKSTTTSLRETRGSPAAERAFTTRSDGSTIHAGLKLPVLPDHATEAEKQAALHEVTNSLLAASSLSRNLQASPHNGAQSSDISSRDFEFGLEEIGWGGGGWGGSGWDTGWGGWGSGGGSHHGGGGGGGNGYIDSASVAHGMPASHLGGDTSKGNWTTDGPIGYISDDWQYIKTAEAVEANYKLLGVPPSPDDLNNVLGSITKHDKKKYNKGHSEVLENHVKDLVAHGSQAHELIKQIIQSDTGKDPDEAIIKDWQDKLGDAKSDLTIADIKKSVAKSQETADHLKETLTYMTGEPSLASDHFIQYYQNELAGDKDWNSVYNEILNCNELNGWLQDKTKFMTGDDANESQMNYYHERLRDGKNSADLIHDIAYGTEARNKINETLTYMTGDPSCVNDHFTQWYQDEMYHGTSWNDIHGQLLYCNELTDWLHNKTLTMLGQDATDAQMEQFHNELNAGKGSDAIIHDIAYSDEAAQKINETLTYMTGDPSCVNDHFTQWYQDEMYHGTSWNDIHGQLLYCNELTDWLHNKTLTMLGQDATDAQMEQFHNELNAGKGSDAIIHDIAYSEEAQNKFSEYLAAETNNQLTASTDFKNHYSEELASGKDLNTIHTAISHSPEVIQWQAQQGAGHTDLVIPETVFGLHRELTYTNEGGNPEQQTGGYVPGAWSGVTIGHGVDLAQFTKGELIKMGVPKELLDRVPDQLFAHGKQKGLTGKDAVSYISIHHLDFNQNEVDYISAIVYNDIALKISTHYDASTSEIKFNELPIEAQSVLTDLAYLFGPNFNQSTVLGKQKIWKDFVEQDYKSAKTDIIKYLGPHNQRAINDVAELDKIKS